MDKGVWFAVIVAVAVGVFLAWPSSGGTGTLRLQITDTPTNLNISSVLVTLSNVEVHRAASENESNSTNATEGWFTVVAGPVTYDLYTLTNVKELLGTQELQAGKYTQIRLNVDNAMVTISGTEYNLSIPSRQVKLINPFTIESGETTTLTLDFDANASVVKTGTSVYRMNPTIKVLE